MPLKALLFDLDNTLFDRDRAFRRWVDDFIRAPLGLRDAAHRAEARDLLMALDARLQSEGGDVRLTERCYSTRQSPMTVTEPG